MNFAVLIRQDSKIGYSYDGSFEASEVIVLAQGAIGDRFATLEDQSWLYIRYCTSRTETLSGTHIELLAITTCPLQNRSQKVHMKKGRVISER